MKVLLIDNFDSFSYNLVHYLEDLGANVTVQRNDAVDLEAMKNYDKIVLSPGPGIPVEAGMLMQALQHGIDNKMHILGVCLGQQAIIEALGGKIINLDQVFHGIATPMYHQGAPLFHDVPSPFDGGRYHSWVGEESSLPASLKVTARDASGQIMAIQHETLPIHAVQFHPESIMTPQGKTMIKNFLQL